VVKGRKRKDNKGSAKEEYHGFIYIYTYKHTHTHSYLWFVVIYGLTWGFGFPI